MSRKRSGSSLLSGLAQPLAAVRRAFSARRKPTPTPMPRPSAFAAPPDEAEEDPVLLALEQMRSEEGGKFQTKLQIVSLVEFRDAVADKWYKISRKVMMIAEGVILKHLGPGNVFSRQGQDMFILLFRTCSTEEGRQRAVAIAQELGARLLGDQFEAGDRPLALAAELSVEEGLNPDGTINLASLHNAVGEIRAMMATPPPLQAPALPPLDRVARPDDDPQWEKLDGSGPRGDADPHWEALESQRARAAAADPAWEALTVAKPRTVIDPLEPTPAAALVPPLPPGARLSVLWRPTWSADGENIGVYRARIRRLDREGAAPLEGAAAYPPEHGASIHALDLHVMSRAAVEVKGLETARNPALLALPLHWESASGSARMMVTAPLGEIPAPIREARLLFELFGVPENVSPRQLMETVRALRQLGRDVLLRVSLSTPAARMAADCGVAMIGIDIAELPPGERVDDGALIAALKAFRQTAETVGLGAYMWGARHRHVIADAMADGFWLVNGPALMKDLPHPAKVLPAPRSRVLAMLRPA